MMSKLILYHGSPRIVEHPTFGAGKKYNDYGQGLYTTEHIELAMEWACAEGTDGYANKYELETEGLKVLDLSSEEFSILNWLAILMANRKVRISSPIASRGREYLIRNFLPSYEDADAIIGWRADDSYFSFARSFVSNEISLKQLGYAMKLGKLGEQFVLKSEKSFQAIKFLGYAFADGAIYYPKRKSRDDNARKDFLKELEKEDIDGIYMRDIIKEGMMQNDPRLR